MPTFVKGNMWDIFGKTDLFFITTNPIRRKDGAVVMGRGIAAEFKQRYPQGPYDFGKRLSSMSVADPATGLIGQYDGQVVGFFMVKDHWANRAKLSIIERSVKSLDSNLFVTDFVTGKRKRPLNIRIDLNFPGIGNGGLDREYVLPLLKDLPDNVHIWEFE